MKKCLNFFTLISFVLFTAPLFAQTFGEVDFERLLMNHPMMKNYDSQTGHFKNTPHELRNVADLKAENASMTAEIKDIVKKESEKSSSAINDDIDDEEGFWDSVSNLAKKQADLEYRIRKNNELIETNGDPGYQKLYPIVDDMCNDLFVPLYDKDKVVLNKLPRYFIPLPDFNGKDMHNFWFKKDPRILEGYLENASVLALIFANSDKTVLYQKPGVEK